MDLSNVTIFFLSLALFTTCIALFDSSSTAKWARNPWGIPVLVAVIFGIVQERSPTN